MENKHEFQMNIGKLTNILIDLGFSKEEAEQKVFEIMSELKDEEEA